MSGNYWCLLAFCSLLLNSVDSVASRVEHGALIYDNIPDAPAELTNKVEAYLSARQATPLNWSPNGQLLVTTRFGEVDQLHIVERPAGARRQVTFLREPVTEGGFSPDPSRMAYVFVKAVGGDENAQIYYQRLGDPEAKLLTPGNFSNGGALWSNSGRELAFFSTARDGVNQDIDVVEPEAGSLPRLAVTGDAAAWRPLDWSPDDRKLLVLKSVSVGEAYLYVVDLSSGQRREVDRQAAKAGISAAKFSRDGQGVYLVSNRDAEFAQLRYVSLFAAQNIALSDHVSGDVEELAISRDGHYLAYVSNEAGADKLNILDLRTHQDLPTPRLPAAGIIDHLSFDADGKRLAFAFAAANLPGDVYVLDVATHHIEAWTHSEAGAVDSAKFVLPRILQFPTFDRVDGRPRQEPVYVYEPASPGQHPVIVVLHGAPESQFRPGFDPWIQYLVNELGFAVVAPNLRGSSGYGKTYQGLDNGVLRDDVVKDLGALIVWAGLQAGFDAKRVVVAGDSYGGFLALAALANYGDRLIGGVDMAGISDFIGFLTNTAPYRQTMRRAEYGDERDPEMRAYLRRLSPSTNADRISRPLLVVHGKNDPQVPLTEAEQIVTRLRSRGGEVWFLQAKNEGDEFRKQQNRVAYYTTFASFLRTVSSAPR